MDHDASLDRYREAARNDPGLAPSDLPDAEAASTGSDGAGPESAPAFPPQYEIVGCIARTRLSTTWRAIDRECQAEVVIKELAARLTIDDRATERFRREAQLIARLVHANIVPIRATHLSEPPYFFTMPLVEGEHLDEYCRARGLGLRQRLRLFLRICTAVSYAHQQGVIHRDLKPANILVDEDGQPQLLDFGIGQLLEATNSPDGQASPGVAGTPRYMAPEQAAGLPGDTRTDVYALGVILFELLTGGSPVEPSDDLPEFLRRVRESSRARARDLRAAVPIELDAILAQALAITPAKRYGSVNDLARDVDGFLAHRPVSALSGGGVYQLRKWLRRNRLAATAGALVTVGALLFTAFAVFMWHSRSVTRQLAEAAAHVRQVTTGRWLADRGDPAPAARLLWQSYFRAEANERLDLNQPRFSLWEFYRRYPCLFAVSRADARPISVKFLSDDEYLFAAWSDGALTVHDAADGTRTHLISGHVARASRLVVSRSGNVYVAGRDGRIQIWSHLWNGRFPEAPAEELALGSGPIDSLALAPSGCRLAAAIGSEVHVLECGETLDEFSSWRVDSGPIRGLAFAPHNEDLLAVGTMDAAGPDGSTLRIHDVRSGRLVAEAAEASPFHHRSVCFSNDGTRLYFGAECLCVWDWQASASEPEPPRRLEQFSEWGVRAIDRSPDPAGRYVVYAGGDGRIRLYDTQGDCVTSFQGFHECESKEHLDVSFSPDGRRVASAGPDGLRVWLCAPPGQIEMPEIAETVSCYIDLGGADSTIVTVDLNKRLIATSEVEQCAHEVHVLDFTKDLPSPIASTRRYSGETGRSYVSAAGSSLISAVYRTAEPDTHLRLTALEHSEHASRTLKVPDADLLTPCRFGADDGVHLLVCGTRQLAPGGPRDGFLVVYRSGAMAGGSLPELERVSEFDTECTWAVWDPRSGLLAACSQGHSQRGLAIPARVTVWRSTGKPLPTNAFDEAFEFERTFAVPTSTWRLAFARDSDGQPLLVSAGSHSRVYLWDPYRGRLHGVLEGHNDAIFDCRSVADELLVTASRDGTVRVWDVATREELGVLVRAPTGTPTIAVHDRRIAIFDGTIVQIADLRDVDRFITGNIEFERAAIRWVRR